MQDAADFAAVVAGNKSIDLDLLRQLGKIIYSGGGDEVLRYVANVRAGRTFSV